MTEASDLSKLANRANAVYNSITSNATAITAISVGGTTINASGVSGNSNVFVGNTTANAVVNSTALTISNSTVTYSYTAPTAAQQSNTSFFLNANGSWAAVSTMPVVSSLNALQLGII
jgi:hypothetical protein